MNSPKITKMAKLGKWQKMGNGGKWGKWQNRGFGGIPKNGEIGEIAYFGGIWGKCPNSQNRGSKPLEMGKLRFHTEKVISVHQILNFPTILHKFETNQNTIDFQ